MSADHVSENAVSEFCILEPEDTIVKKISTCEVISEAVNAGLFAITLLYVQWANFEPVKI